MVRLLPSIFLVDVLPEAAGGCDFHFRLIGTGIVEVEGEHTGERLSALYTKRDADAVVWRQYEDAAARSEEHTSELQSLMRISYAVFCLTKKKEQNKHNNASI